MDWEEAMTRFRYQDAILFGEPDENIGQSQNPQIQQVADILMEFGMVELLHHFRKLWRFRHMKM